jgi:hypothetical protein
MAVVGNSRSALAAVIAEIIAAITNPARSNAKPEGVSVHRSDDHNVTMAWLTQQLFVRCRLALNR